MKILVVGGGGREHAIIKKLKENKTVTEIFAIPGNGGIAKDATCVDIGAKDIDKIVAFAVENAIEYAVVAPDDPLVLGCVDALEEKGIPCFGPRANAAIIEGSKVFSKNLMKKYNIPTATYEVFTDMESAISTFPLLGFFSFKNYAIFDVFCQFFIALFVVFFNFSNTLKKSSYIIKPFLFCNSSKFWIH